jgi:hypothetical protein
MVKYCVIHWAQPGRYRWTSFSGPLMPHYSSVLTTKIQLRTSYAKFKMAG